MRLRAKLFADLLSNCVLSFQLSMIPVTPRTMADALLSLAPAELLVRESTASRATRGRRTALLSASWAEADSGALTGWLGRLLSTTRSFSASVASSHLWCRAAYTKLRAS